MVFESFSIHSHAAGLYQMSRVARKPVFRVSDQVSHKPGCTITEDARGLKFRIKEVEGLHYLCSKTMALISCAVTAQLSCVFVFAYAKSSFSHDAAQIELNTE